MVTVETDPVAVSKDILNARATAVLGLIAVMLTVFLMLIVYMGQQTLIELATKSLDKQSEEARILSDIRYALNAKAGISFRNDANVNP